MHNLPSLSILLVDMIAHHPIEYIPINHRYIGELVLFLVETKFHQPIHEFWFI